MARTGFDDVAIRLAPGANERDVIAAVDRVLSPYGGRGAHACGMDMIKGTITVQ